MRHPLRKRRTPLALALAGTLALAGLAGCDSFLETEPLGELTSESFFETPEQAVQATNATYNMLRNWNVHVFAWIGMTDIASDDATKGSTPADASFLRELDELTFDPSNGAFSGTWNGYYQGIYRANVALQNIPDVPNMDETLRNRLLAENRFLRAYYYFFLARAFGGVPLITEPLRPSEFEQQRATEEAVYDLIEEDLQFAIENLPESYGGADAGRATEGAARGLLASAYLFQEDYENAYAQAIAVVNSGQYALLPSYSRLFSPEGENSSESVFEVQTVALEAGGGGAQYAQVQGVRGFPNIGWGFNQPSPDLEAAYEPGDPRLQATILFPWEMIPDGSGLVTYINPQVTNQRYNEKAFTPPDTPRGSGNAGVNIRRLRYADVVLIAAEAAFQTGREAEARDLLNQVRERARDADVTLGFTPEELSAGIATNVLGLDAGTSRVFVRYVDEDSWADDAGLRSFASARFDYTDGSLTPVLVQNLDLIQAVNGTPVTTPADFFNALQSVGAGQSVALDVLRVSQSSDGSDVTTATEALTLNVEARQLLPPVTASGQALLEAIWHERRVELAMEQHRWFDIIRQGRAQQVLADVGVTFVPGKHDRYPIPSREVDLVGLQQNPGY